MRKEGSPITYTTIFQYRGNKGNSEPSNVRVYDWYKKSERPRILATMVMQNRVLFGFNELRLTQAETKEVGQQMPMAAKLADWQWLPLQYNHKNLVLAPL